MTTTTTPQIWIVKYEEEKKWRHVNENYLPENMAGEFVTSHAASITSDCRS